MLARLQCLNLIRYQVSFKINESYVIFASSEGRPPPSRDGLLHKGSKEPNPLCAVPDVGILIFSASFASAQGLGNVSLAGTVGPGGFFYPTAFQPGSLVGPGLFFGANSGDVPNSFGTLANSLGAGGPGVGNWMGGGDAYLGARFTIGVDAHYGWVHVVWDPDSDSLSVDQYAYDNSPNSSAMVTPEPSSLVLLALGAVGLARRRRCC